MRTFYDESDENVLKPDYRRLTSVLRSVKNWTDGPRPIPEGIYQITLRTLIEELEILVDEA